MDAAWNSIKQLNASGIPIGKIIVVFVILVLAQTLRRFIVLAIVKTIERLTKRTATDLDDELIRILKPALSWLILIGGLWLSKEILEAELGEQLSEVAETTLSWLAVFIVLYAVYRSASVFGQLIANVVLHADTELDELLRPLLPKIFQAAAIMIIAIKVAEILLGQSAGALVGLIGGAGITIGLLLKDIVYDWFCTLVIYSDGLYREGDWVSISGVNGFVEILNIGFRTTTLHLSKWGSIVKMPNSQMISGIVENWSQNPGEKLKWGLVLNLKIDNITAKQTSKICNAIREMPKRIAGLEPNCTVRFKHIEQNARAIEIITFVNDANLYFDAETDLNLAILELLEQEGIDFLYVDLRTTPEKYRQDRREQSTQILEKDLQNLLPEK
ncbi:MAG: mechanosensitive ion channel [Cyanobacteriota bacterium]|nr:mechanosensitive ion channel [Cyanobacteriota bacterium]